MKSDWEKAKERARRKREREDREAKQRDRFADASFMKRFRSGQKSLAALFDVMSEWTATSVHMEHANEGRLRATYVTADKGIPEESDEHFTHCVESLRASLDQLAFMLSEGFSGPLTEQQERDSKFPIHRTEVHANDRRAWKGIELMSPEAAEVIRKLQPAVAFPQAPSSSPLLLLADLAERSKHRSGLVAATAAAPSLRAGNGMFEHLEIHAPRIVPGERSLVFRTAGRVPRDTVSTIAIVGRVAVPGSIADGSDLMGALTSIVEYLDGVVFPRLTAVVRA